MNKRQTAILKSYNDSILKDLYDCYNNPSRSKLQAYEEIIQEMCLNNGYAPRILSYNTFMFTIAYKYVDKGFEVLVYHTPSKKEEIVINL